MVRISRTTTARRHGRLRRHAARLALVALIGATGNLANAPTAAALPPENPGVSLVTAPDGNGYAVISSVGGQYNYGSSRFSGSMAGRAISGPMVDAVNVPGKDATWMVSRDGGVYALGGAPFYGSMAGQHLNKPITAVVASPTGLGYLLVAEDGGTFAFGDYPHPGSIAHLQLQAPVVDAARSANGGLWMVAADGGVFAINGAPFHGSMGGQPLNKPMTAIVSTPAGEGYLLVAQDGGTFAYGGYPFPGSFANIALNAPIVEAAYAKGQNGGVWLVAADGGVFTLRAPFYGSATGEANPPPPPVGTTPVPTTGGGLVTVTCSDGGKVTVGAIIGQQVANLFAAAKADGVLMCGWGYRTAQRQIELRKQNCGTSQYAIWQKPSRECSPPTAIPGRSMHERGGLAIDFHVKGATCRSTQRCFTWLKANANRFGLYNLPSESWHWSTNGN